MQRPLLIGVGGFSLVVALYIWCVPQHWYDTVPGVSQTGPLNLHFAKDVALAFLSSALALIWAGRNGDRTAALCGSAWLVFHGLFHIWIWIHRGTPFDLIALTNLTGIFVPASIALWASLTLKTEGAAQ